MPPGVDLVRLGAGDAGEVLTLQRAAWVSEARLHDDLDLPPLVQTLDQLRADLADDSVTTLGLRLAGPSAGRLVAMVRLAPAEVTESADGGTVELGRLAVAPDLQGRGLGARMLALAEEALPPGVTRLRLFTGEHSTANLRLYRRAGYVETHRTRLARYDLVHLTKDLGRHVPRGPQPG